MKKMATIIVAVFLSLTGPLWADGGDSSEPDPVPAKITRLIESEQYDLAMAELKVFVGKEKKNANAWNWLGYSQRTLGDLDASLKSYKKALRLDRKHLGANEYLGELYIMRGEMKKAKKQLKKLGKYCGDCDQFKKLEEVIKNSESG
jgi:tetratricopeptide (TPR) repeat protein